jgi:glycosyltransferase involved in cell wall biosynthesis
VSHIKNCSEFILPQVHIKISDTNWILERMAREIAERLPYVTYDIYNNSSADIQYYMTYGCWEQKISPIEIACFTHKEIVPSAAEKFDHTARHMDFCVAQSLTTERILRANGVNAVETISPGVDLDKFFPKLKIGVVGRTYHTGRKGEALVVAVMDIPNIEWHFTGSGWPGPPEFIPDKDLPAFYRSLDYVLVPSLIEGGPMCVPEALACGCKVIASDVGWVSEFPHIAFKKGDAEDLRRVLLSLLEEKMALNHAVESYTWEAFAQKHHQLFMRLSGCEENLVKSSELSSSAEQNSMKVAVAVHGQEMSVSLGGPSVRAPRTAVALQRIGVSAEFKAANDFCTDSYDLIHVLNVWHPNACEVLLRQIEKNHRPSVFSPIFLDLSERVFFDNELIRILKNSNCNFVNSALKNLRAEIAVRRLEKRREHADGYFSHIRRLMTYPEHLILLSKHEKNELSSIGVNHASVSIIKNPVEFNVFANADPRLFEETYNVKDYVLCVGRIESRKNQALLAYALHDTNLPLVFIGHEPSAGYADLVRKWAGKNALFLERLPAGGSLLASAFAGARVFCLPSWSEGAPLAALEAAAAGCSMVLSNRSSEEEYFGELARYIDPCDPDDIREKILEAYEEDFSHKRKKLQTLIKEQHNWKKYAEETYAAYQLAQENYAVKIASRPVVENRKIFIDLTTSANHSGPPTGMARVEERLGYELKKLNTTLNIQYVIWNSPHRKFIGVDEHEVSSDEIKLLKDSSETDLFENVKDATVFSELDFQCGDILLVFGSAWMRNGSYLADLWNLKSAKGVFLVTAIYDVVQYMYKEIYEDTVAKQFLSHCSKFIGISDMIFTCSKYSAKDIRIFSKEMNIPLAPIKVFRLGDEPVHVNEYYDVLQVKFITDITQGKPFVCFVSSIDARKNHQMLLLLWKKLMTQYGDLVPHLFFVGRKGWSADVILKTLQADVFLCKKVHQLENVDDQALEWLYQNCLFTVYPSLYEGWGLPVAESIQRGKLCIASSASSLPEIAPGFAEYIDPQDFMKWFHTLEQYLFSRDLLAKANEKCRHFKLTEWSETAKTVVDALFKLEPSVERLNSLEMGKKLRCHQGESSLVDSFLGGWGRIESTGIWMVGIKSLFGFQLDSISENPIALIINATPFYIIDNIPLKVKVVLNNVPLITWEFHQKSACKIVCIPPAVLNESRSVIIHFFTENSVQPSHISGSKDNRWLGLRVKDITLSPCIELKKNYWTNVCYSAQNTWVLHCVKGLDDCRYIGIDVHVNKITELAIDINGVYYTSVHVRKSTSGTRIFQYDFSVGQESVFLEIRVLLGESVKVARVGVFKKTPKNLVGSVLKKKTYFSEKKKLMKNFYEHLPFSGRLPESKINKLVTLDNNCSYGQGFVGGWYEFEPDGIWMGRETASLHIRLDKIERKTSFIIKFEFEVYKYLLTSDLELMVKIGNSEPVALIDSKSFPEPLMMSVFKKECKVLTKDALTNGILSLTFYCNSAISPESNGESLDKRFLSMKLQKIFVGTSQKMFVGEKLQKIKNWVIGQGKVFFKRCCQVAVK